MKPARILVEALRLDRGSVGEVRRRARAALDVGAGGFVLFGGEASEVAALVADLRRRAGRPLWMAADLERGAGQQFRGCEDLPPPAALARHPEPEKAVRTAASLTAREALSVGVNWVLAPVLDLDVEASNPIVGTRSFGEDPARVAALGRAWIEACQAEGAAACMKHVPGHGRTTSDSHAGLPVVEASRDVLAADLEPFRRAAPVASTAMLAHVAYPALAGGRRRPATLEPALARDLLREELGFRGPAATDAMTMEGFETGGEGATEALRAGCDLLLYPRDLRAAAAELVRDCARSPAVRGRLDEALRRSERALASPGSGLTDGTGASPDERPAPEAVDPEALDRMAEACIVSRGDSPGQVFRGTGTVEVVILDDDRDLPTSCAGESSDFGRGFVETLVAGGAEVRGIARGPEAVAGREAGRTEGPTVLLVRATPRAWKGRAALSPELDRAAGRVLEGGDAYPLVFGHRRLLEALGRPGACVWWGRPRAERAAARWLLRRLTG